MKRPRPLAPRARVKLADAEFDKLRAAIGIVAEVELDAMKIAQQLDQRMADAKGKAQALFTVVMKTHGLDPNLSYRLDDATREIVLVKP